MSYSRKPYKHTKPGDKTSKPDVGKTSPGFSGLDPSRMGFDMPDWLAESPPDTSPPAPQQDESATPQETSTQSRSLLEGMKVVCICKGIKKRVFWDALDDGAQTKEDVNRVTGSGSGSCQGRRCGPRILDMLRHRPT